MTSNHAFQKCIDPKCAATFSVDETLTACPKCGNLLDLQYEWDKLALPKNLAYFEKYWSQRNIPQRFSGVWRFQELLPFTELENCLTIGEGQTLLQQAPGVAEYVGMQTDKLFLQYEGMNPSGSFKDNGMVAAVTHAKMMGATAAACASTGNTSASLALYCGVTRLMKAVIFIGSGKIAYGKLSQALDAPHHAGACLVIRPAKLQKLLIPHRVLGVLAKKKLLIRRQRLGKIPLIFQFFRIRIRLPGVRRRPGGFRCLAPGIQKSADKINS